jgi:division protein CdvB (Snf7/Vps24/ESCRT-III family)
MSEKFLKNWESSDREALFHRFKTGINPGPPLKQRLTNTLYRLNVVSHRLNDSASRLEQRGREFFDKCTAAQIAKDNDRAAMYANECAEIRKMAKIVLHSQMAIEQVTLRLETVKDFGEVAAQMAPVVPIVQAIKTQLVGVMPQVSSELSTIGDTLNSFIVEAGETMGTGYDMVASGEEAQRILREAGAIADQKMIEKFPELPTSLPKVPSAERGSLAR